MSKTHFSRLALLHASYLINGAKNPFLWIQLIKSYLSHNSLHLSILTYNHCLPNRTQHFTIIPQILKFCNCSLSYFPLCKSLHADAIKLGASHMILVGTSLISMYCKHGEILSAYKVFDEMPERNEVTYNVLLDGYVANGNNIQLGLDLFAKIGVKTQVTWSTMIKGLVNSGDVALAREFFEKAPNEMKNVITWTIMVNGYAKNGNMEAAKDLFDKMPVRNCFVWSSMIKGYFKKGEPKKAQKIFDSIPARNLVHYNALIAGYSQIGSCEMALNAFKKMQEKDKIEPDEYTIAAILSACAQIGYLQYGKYIHELIIRNNIYKNLFVLNGLVDMYAKCGDLKSAREVFDKMPKKHTQCFNSMILGLASHGQTNEALELFNNMKSIKINPNEITYLAVLVACTHGGFVDKGLKIFIQMEKNGYKPNLEQYGCIIDLLGRNGRLKEAYNIVKKMHIAPNNIILGSLLAACKLHGDKDMIQLLMHDINNKHGFCTEIGAEYVTMENILKGFKKFEEAEGFRRERINYRVVKRKIAGCSVVL